DAPPLAPTAGAVQLGVHRDGPVPGGALEPFDILLSADPAAPGPWVGVPAARLDATIAGLRDAVARQPVAAAACAQVLRTSLDIPFDQALAAESMAYSMLLASEGFRAWRAANPPRTRPDDGRPRVRIGVTRSIAVHLDRPAARNAVDARMRD